MSSSFESKLTDNASIQTEIALIEQNDASVRGKDAVDAKAVITDVDTLQVIMSKEIMRILSCQTTKISLLGRLKCQMPAMSFSLMNTFLSINIL